MAVTLTVAQLAAALRLGDSAEETAEATRLLSYGTAAVSRHLRDAFEATPAEVVNEAVIRLAGYLFDQPNAGRGTGYANALRNSGAAAILLPHRVHRAGSTGTAEAAAAVAIPATGGLNAAQVRALIEDEVPSWARMADPPDAGTVDRDARNAAAANARALAGKQDTLEEPSGREVDEGVAATIRGWTSALVRRAINAAVPAWARAEDPPEPDVLHVSAADTFHGSPNAIALRNVPDTETGRRYGFFVEMANTAAVRVTVGAVTQPLIDNEGDALAGGELVPGEFVEIVDDGTSFRIIGGSATGHPAAVADGTITTDKLADRAVTQPKIGLEAVGAREIAAEAVRTGHIADNAVTGSKIPSDAIASRHVAADSITRGELAADAVGTAELVDNGVTEAKLSAEARGKLNARAAGGSDAEARAGVRTNAAAIATNAAAIEGKQDALTHAQLVDLLQFTVVPQVVIGRTEDDVTLDWRIWVSGGETLPDTWMSLHLEGLSTLAAPVPSTPGADLHRHKLSAAVIYQFTLGAADRTNLVNGRTGRRQGRSISAEIRFHDAITGGAVVDRRTIGIDWLPAPEAPAPAAPVLLATLANTSGTASLGTDAQFNAVRSALNGRAYESLRIEATYPRTFGPITDGEGYAQHEWQIPAGLNVPAGGGRDVYFREFGGVASDQSGLAEVLSLTVRPGAASGERLRVSHRLPAGSTIRVYGVA